MKRFYFTVSIIILSVLINLTVYSQQAISVGAGSVEIDFENPVGSNYILINDYDIWFIGEPKKNNFNSSYDGLNSIMTDTSLYYDTNIYSSFQFRLKLEYCCDLYSMSFFHKYDFDKNKDGGFIETSYNNGKSWQNIINDTIIFNNLEHATGLYTINDTISSIDNESGFTGKQYDSFKTVQIIFRSDDIYMYNLDTMLVKFTVSSDSIQSDNEGWLLDNFDFGAILADIDYIPFESAIQLTPNPATDYISLSSDIEMIYNIKIIDLNGVVLFDTDNTNRIDISSLSSGLYLVRINDKYIKKIVKQ